ncbi:MAG: peptide chain release factor 1 [Clostridia bacterium]|nr:peptide chain release factor 1 [Clostridia bacterium]
MNDKIRSAASRLSQIDEMLSDTAIASDAARQRALLKERKSLEPLALKVAEYETAERRIADNETLLAAETDPDIRALAAEELAADKGTLAALDREIQILLIPKDPNADRNVILEIRAGAGGEEAALFAADLYRMYTMYADSRGFKTEVISANETELGGYREVDFRVSGDGVYDRLRFESGVHRVQRIPVTESNGKIQTSTVTVAVLPEAEAVEVEINPADITIETIKSTGAGGQHINKTESAVRLTHKPSGIVIEARNERSQLQNKEQAMRLLRTRLLDRKRAEVTGAISDTRRAQVGSGDRSEKIRTYHYGQSRVTDHRIGLSLHSLDMFLNGRMDTMIDALAAADAAAKLGSTET